MRLALLLALLCVSCTTPQWIIPEGGSMQNYYRDHAFCSEQAGHPAPRRGGFLEYMEQQQTFEYCMLGNGYTIDESEPPPPKKRKYGKQW